MCNYENCTYNNILDSEYCIFHLKDNGKNIEVFNNEINRIIELDGEINFKGFYFPSGTGNFKGKSFDKNVCFEEAIFEGEANFKFVHFYGDITDFTRTKFKQNVSFMSAEFNKVNFNSVEFSKDASFIKVKFLENAEFCFAIFSGNVGFQGAKFKKAYFNGSNFSKNAFFQNTEFNNEVNFSNVTFDEKMVFITKNPLRIYLNEVTFSNDVRIKAGLQNCSFDGSNIERVDLTNCGWTLNKEKEIKILEHKNNLDYDKLVEIYRRLRQSCQRYGDHFNAGEFFYQEMDCKRNQMKGIQKFIWIIIKGACGYGERPIRVIRTSAIIIIFFTFLYFYSGIRYMEKGTGTLIDHQFNFNSLKIFISEFDYLIFPIIKDFFWCFYTSIITFTTLGYGDVYPVGFWSRLSASIESLIGIIMTATLIFVLSRKILR